MVPIERSFLDHLGCGHSTRTLDWKAMYTPSRSVRKMASQACNYHVTIYSFDCCRVSYIVTLLVAVNPELLYGEPATFIIKSLLSFRDPLQTRNSHVHYMYSSLFGPITFLVTLFDIFLLNEFRFPSEYPGLRSPLLSSVNHQGYSIDQ